MLINTKHIRNVWSWRTPRNTCDLFVPNLFPEFHKFCSYYLKSIFAYLDTTLMLLNKVQINVLSCFFRASYTHSERQQTDEIWIWIDTCFVSCQVVNRGCRLTPTYNSANRSFLRVLKQLFVCFCNPWYIGDSSAPIFAMFSLILNFLFTTDIDFILFHTMTILALQPLRDVNQRDHYVAFDYTARIDSSYFLDDDIIMQYVYVSHFSDDTSLFA